MIQILVVLCLALVVVVCTLSFMLIEMAATTENIESLLKLQGISIDKLVGSQVAKNGDKQNEELGTTISQIIKYVGSNPGKIKKEFIWVKFGGDSQTLLEELITLKAIEIRGGFLALCKPHLISSKRS